MPSPRSPRTWARRHRQDLLQAALAQAVGDPELQIAYWLPDSQRYVDARADRSPSPRISPGRTLTRSFAMAAGLRSSPIPQPLPDLERAIGAAVRLALENERLQAETLAQLDQLRASRVRIVETGDAERRQLERDLHDGAQQRLLALSYDLRLARAQAQADVTLPPARCSPRRRARHRLL